MRVTCTWRRNLAAFTLSGLMAATACWAAEPGVVPDAADVEPSTRFGNETQVFHGPAVRIGDGVARTTIAFDRDNVPRSIGVILSEKALESLPSQPGQYVLRFHPKADVTQYTHVLLDFNPQGHDPPGTY